MEKPRLCPSCAARATHHLSGGHTVTRARTAQPRLCGTAAAHGGEGGSVAAWPSTPSTAAAARRRRAVGPAVSVMARRRVGAPACTAGSVGARRAVVWAVARAVARADAATPAAQRRLLLEPSRSQHCGSAERSSEHTRQVGAMSGQGWSEARRMWRLARAARWPRARGRLPASPWPRRGCSSQRMPCAFGRATAAHAKSV